MSATKDKSNKMRIHKWLKGLNSVCQVKGSFIEQDTVS